jgi:amidohydrolase
MPWKMAQRIIRKISESIVVDGPQSKLITTNKSINRANTWFMFFIYVGKGLLMIEENLIRKLIQEVFSDVVRIRRDLHMWPELGFHETRTSSQIAQTLASLGIPIKTGLAKTGVIGVLTGQMAESSTGPRQKVVALRADIDALPVYEETELEFASKNHGVMHACGHDIHAAMMLGSAMVLSRLTEHFSGQVKFIFQPAEERLGGGKVLVEEGGLRDPYVDCVFALHLWPLMPYGKIATRTGPIMAAVDNFHIEVVGKGGHGATPHDAIDAIVIGSEIVLALQTIVSRSIDSTSPVVVTVGTFQGGTSSNIIAEKVTITGTVRTLTADAQDTVEGRLKTICRGIAQAYGAECRVDYSKGYPATVNSAECVELVQEVASDVVGKSNVINLELPVMISEDFAFYTERVPGAYFLLGVGDETSVSLHHPKYSPPEDIMHKGIEMFVKLALKYLTTTA